jgi:glycosyltransferase involved in cell wall biosynthesis/2-polyprenyl-3-methyl-5-hydroxy-6-metoxy-1,4-benzoquinol methylase
MPTPLHWTPELIMRFWNGVAELPALEHVSFANLASERLLDLMRDFLDPDMTCLDYGGGSGHLVKALIANGQRVAVYEPSDARAHAVEEKFKNEQSFLGVHGPTSNTTFDAVLCMEVIEHILDGDLAEFLHRMNAHVRPGGLILLTTPYNERLSESEVYCPQCDSVFHRWQHVRNFNATSLRAILATAGFDPNEIALVGFSDAEALAGFVSSRGTDAWKGYHREESGDLFANVGAADHIFFAGRKARAPGVTEIAANLARLRDRRRAWLSLNQVNPPTPATTKAAGLQAETAVFTPQTLNASEASRYICSRVSESGELVEMPAAAAAPVAVFDGDMTDLLATPDQAQVRASSEIHVRDDLLWRRLVRSGVPLPSPPTYIPAAVAVRDNIWASVAPYLFRLPLGRRQQAHFDRSEMRLRELLAETTDFPFRNSHYIEGRVALGISSLSSGGAERQTVYVAAGLHQRGHDDVHLVVDHLRDSPSHSFYLAKAAESARSIREVGNDDLTRIPWIDARPDFWRTLGGYVANRTLNTARHFNELAPEVVQTSLDWTNITMGLAAVMAGVPRVLISGRNLSPTNFGFFQWFMYPAYRALAAQPNVQIFNNSECGARDYEEWLKLPRGSIAVVRNGIDTEGFAPAGPTKRERARAHFKLSPGATVVAGAFRLSPEKRPLLWLKAAAELAKRKPDVEFLVLGAGPMEMQAQMLAYKLGISDRVRFGGVAKDISFAFAAADAVLLTSLQEGTPNVLIEAQAMGIPVVTTPAFGAAEAVHDGVTGCVVSSSRPGRISDALFHILSNDEMRKAMSAAGPVWAKNTFGMDRMIDDVLALHARIPLAPPPQARESAHQ